MMKNKKKKEVTKTSFTQIDKAGLKKLKGGGYYSQQAIFDAVFPNF